MTRRKYDYYGVWKSSSAAQKREREVDPPHFPTLRADLGNIVRELSRYPWVFPVG
jgi:hypothetical protein